MPKLPDNYEKQKKYPMIEIDREAILAKKLPRTYHMQRKWCCFGIGPDETCTDCSLRNGCLDKFGSDTGLRPMDRSDE